VGERQWMTGGTNKRGKGTRMEKEQQRPACPCPLTLHWPFLAPSPSPPRKLSPNMRVTSVLVVVLSPPGHMHIDARASFLSRQRLAWLFCCNFLLRGVLKSGTYAMPFVTWTLYLQRRNDGSVVYLSKYS
jgi:hypothetical protein